MYKFFYLEDNIEKTILIGLTMMISFLENNSHRIDDDDYYRN